MLTKIFQRTMNTGWLLDLVEVLEEGVEDEAENYHGMVCAELKLKQEETECRSSLLKTTFLSEEKW